MKSKLAAAFCLVLLSSTGAAATKAKSTTALPACDRECLRGTLTQVLYGFTDHDTSKLP